MPDKTVPQSGIFGQPRARTMQEFMALFDVKTVAVIASLDQRLTRQSLNRCLL